MQPLRQFASPAAVDHGTGPGIRQAQQCQFGHRTYLNGLSVKRTDEGTRKLAILNDSTAQTSVTLYLRTQYHHTRYLRLTGSRYLKIEKTRHWAGLEHANQSKLSRV